MEKYVNETGKESPIGYNNYKTVILPFFKKRNTKVYANCLGIKLLTSAREILPRIMKERKNKRETGQFA